MTQIEKIRGMSADELAAFLESIENEGFNNVCGYCCKEYCEEERRAAVILQSELHYDYECNLKTCRAAQVAYLESEVEGE